jgi:hypothetical protein
VENLPLLLSVRSLHFSRGRADRIETYLERVELYLDANNFPDGRKVAALLSIIGGPVYEVLRSLLAPALPKSKTFAELVETLKRHY